MRWMLILLYLSLSFLATAQVQKTWIGDTMRVYRFVHDSDTSYNVKFDFRTGTWLIYYEPTFEHLAKKVWYYNRDHSDTSWFRNGQLKGYWIGKDSITHGCYDFLLLSPNGAVKSEVKCNGDSSMQVFYYPGGGIRKIEKEYKSAETHSMRTDYRIEFYENGQPQYDTIYKNGKPSTRNYYYANGKVRMQASYDAAGNYNGEWSFYDESGKLIRKEFHEQGKLMRTIEY